jgi:type IV secretion system protein VirB1
MIDVAFIEQCKNPNVDIEIVQQIIQIESNNKPFSINVNKDGKSFISFTPKTKEEALGLVKDYINGGLSVDIGLMQVNSNNLTLKVFSGLSLEDLFDPCKNIKAGSDIFYMAYAKTDENLSKEERTNLALSVYNTGDEKNGFKNGYVAKYNPQMTTLVNLSLEEEARKSNTKVDISYSLFNLESLKREQ